jgi:crotonobetainyl-CoA:carnitine CoA-transferase CaiB-like acyl-CoA transferase
MLLALYGAEVIKLEPPAGDWSRRLGTTYGNHSALSAVYNRGKRSLCVDLKTVTGRRIARTLARRADVLIEGFRPGVAAKMELGYDSLKQENAALIYVSVSGFGQTGPYARRPCSDAVAQAFAGLVSVNIGSDGVPHRVGATISDVSSGLYAFQAVATSLYAREKTRVGRHIDISLVQSTAALLGHKLAEHMLEDGQPRALNVPGGSYQTRDGWIMVTMVTEPQYQRLCQVVGRSDLAQNPRYDSFAKRADHADTLVTTFQAALETDTTAIWLDKLKAADVIAERILNFGDWRLDPHVLATGAVVAVETEDIGVVHVSRTPGSFAKTDNALAPAPTPGEHSRAVLVEAGFTDNEIESLIASRTVFVPSPAAGS